ncbi:MAG TPA: XRE family transcriptional regulator [Acidimicrobiales bacterium]
MTVVRSPAELGGRIAEAREVSGLTQAALAERLGVDRTSVVRLEAGQRKVSAHELAEIAEILGRPIDWFVVASPPAVLSRRRDLASGHTTTLSLDREVERAARDVEFLLDRGVLTWSRRRPAAIPTSHSDAERLATDTRRWLRIAHEPLVDLAAHAEKLGVVAFSVDLDDTDEGACVELSGTGSHRLGVAVINGNQDPGRRRWTLAHELGHFLIGDAYAGTHPGGEIEKYLNSFVAHLLMPRSGVEKLWRTKADQGTRVAALTLSARYRVSWSAACKHLCSLGLLDGPSSERLREERPTPGDYLALGESWVEELCAPFVPPTYTQRVLSAYVDGELTAERTVELLRSTLRASELPTQNPPSFKDLRTAFGPLP